MDKNYVGKINRAIIDIHLRFHNHVFEQMAPYKWVPLALAAVFQMIRVRRPPVLFPVVWVYLFDYYFYDYFAWREREKNIINIQSSFDYKLAKASSKISKRFCRYREEVEDGQQLSGGYDQKGKK